MQSPLVQAMPTIRSLLSIQRSWTTFSNLQSKSTVVIIPDISKQHHAVHQWKHLGGNESIPSLAWPTGQERKFCHKLEGTLRTKQEVQPTIQEIFRSRSKCSFVVDPLEPPLSVCENLQTAPTPPFLPDTATSTMLWFQCFPPLSVTWSQERCVMEADHSCLRRAPRKIHFGIFAFLQPHYYLQASFNWTKHCGRSSFNNPCFSLSYKNNKCQRSLFLRWGIEAPGARDSSCLL